MDPDDNPYLSQNPYADKYGYCRSMWSVSS